PAAERKLHWIWSGSASDANTRERLKRGISAPTVVYQPAADGQRRRGKLVDVRQYMRQLANHGQTNKGGINRPFSCSSVPSLNL
ncbi:MAG: hypothetical protein OXF20_09345, partial [Gammaproteobacteria bacterium]|nr:hypothetical protein [Gammaproteobacteria bacterium]